MRKILTENDVNEVQNIWEGAWESRLGEVNWQEIYSYTSFRSTPFPTAVCRGERGELYQFLLEVKFLLRFNNENDR